MKFRSKAKFILFVTGFALFTLIGFFVYKSGGQSFNRTLSEEENRKLQPPRELPTTSPFKPEDFLTYTDTTYGITFAYPPDWQLNPDTQNFSAGDIISVQIWGKTQTEGTEFFDGAYFTIGIPLSTGLSLDDWLKSEFLSSSDESINQKPRITKGVALGVFDAVQVYLCNLGCFTYRFTKVEDRIYPVIYFSEGKDSKIYNSQIDQILSSFNISP
ncbi:hypothetical protein A3B48_01270 [Candidatus Gottesmanbacteria bacterium RIFCSPLOWO2_01_FULL_40_10]|nr:MAG: hypothetical protein A3B48_01270 [Candidatus Gottesmanbacteria bacterium RIFCSPLOWO2_01_FULL_40_10]